MKPYQEVVFVVKVNGTFEKSLLTCAQKILIVSSSINIGIETKGTKPTKKTKYITYIDKKYDSSKTP